MQKLEGYFWNYETDIKASIYVVCFNISVLFSYLYCLIILTEFNELKLRASFDHIFRQLYQNKVVCKPGR